ncbi:MAG: hypothetical protein J5661_04900 [Bacteroidaceae bacterium]|nr:hypothetical protein [Bacteroidaceae bacterium]
MRAQQACSDYWSATDGLGRTLQRYDESKQDKTVIMFYWTWHNSPDASGTEVKNISQILRQYPEAIRDAKHSAWVKNRSRNDYYWEEPLFGYYLTTDTWVLRKHAELLADAGVDAIFTDCTNGSLTWDESTDSLLYTWKQAKQDGVKVPKIAFLLPFGPSNHSLTSLRHLYKKYYSNKEFSDMWFYWEGKPCIMAYPNNLTDSKEDQAIRRFFTFRPGQPDYVDGPNRHFPNQWGWLENYPQHGYVPCADGQFELVTVGVAQNTAPEKKGHCSAFNLPGSHSRSFTARYGFDPRPQSYLYGANFEEQWDRAYEINPKAVFVTGWNEWIAGMWFESDGWTGKPFSFVDEFDWDRSRDIEPVKAWGDCADSYYMQLVNKVRRFKGTESLPLVSSPHTIKMGEWEEWKMVLPYYASYKGNTRHRNALGRGDSVYVNNTGRNDLIGARVARDADYLYFYVETAEKITPQTDSNWMMLFINADRSQETGWQGYDYVINYRSPKGSKAYVQKSRLNKWIWEDAGEAQMKVDGNRLMLRVPRKVLALETDPLNFEFKWSDNMQDEGNLMDFYVNGDVAPGGRFNFVYTVK